MSTAPNRRSERRFAHISTVMIEDTGKGYFYYGTMRNYSAGGMYFESDFVAKPGTPIKIQLENPPFKASPREYEARVIWYDALDEEDSIYNYGIGVRIP
jgi:hypothetical protein